MLDDGGPYHGRATDEETGGNLLDGREADAGLAEGGIDEEVVNRDEDEQGEGVKVGKNVVGDTVALHDGGLGDEVVVDLVVAEPKDGVVTEDSASGETTTELVDPGIVKGHPLGASLVGEA